MINIEDIRERLKRNPEPIEVKEIREKIISTFNSLIFEEGPHKYYLPKDDGTREELISVSSLIHKFEQPTDWDAIAKRYAEKHGLTKEFVQKMWNENNLMSTSNGTSTHLYGEMMMHFCMGNDNLICDVIKPQYEKGYLIPYSKKQVAIMKYWEDLLKIDEIYPVMPETKVYTGINDKLNLKQNYAGTFDCLFAIKKDGKWKTIIHDYKTNKDLYNDFNRSRGVTMLEPFDDMVDDAFSHYVIQQSAYKMALEQIDGIEVIDMKLIWLKDDGTYEKVKLTDISEQIKNALS